ncbi:MAG: hypothetical protein LLG00_13190 [Planctomycetaceae bacterium]|nr:hypothetical protein [Planctomycetaceae bacterium]
MADPKGTGGKKPLPRKPQPKASSLLDEAFDAGMLPAAPAALGAAAAKGKSPSCVRKNRLWVAGLSVGGLLLALLLVLGWQLNWFGSDTPAKPLAAAKIENTPVKTSVAENGSAAKAASPAKSDAATPAVAGAADPGTPKNANSASAGAFARIAAKPSQSLQPTAATPKKDVPTAAAPSKPLTDDFTKWQGENWTRARRENHPKLRDAVVYLGGKKFSGNPRVAVGLSNLLKPVDSGKSQEKSAEKTPTAPNPPPSAGGLKPFVIGGTPSAGVAAPGGAAGPVTLVDAIITALGNNGTKAAQDTIREVLAGTFPTDDDRVAVEAAIRAVVAHPSPGNDALLVQLILTPENVRAAGHQGAWPPKELQAKAFEMAKPSLSSKQRTAIAGAVVKGGAVDPEQPVHKFLLDESPLNCGAQILLYQNAKQEMKAKLERQLLNYSSLAMARYLGVADPEGSGAAGPGGNASSAMTVRPSGEFPTLRIGESPEQKKPLGDAAGQPPKASDKELAAELASQLWTKEFLRLFESELGRSSLDAQAQLLLLASTIPQASTRTQVLNALSKRVNAKSSEEPTPLETAGLVDKVVTDPAIVLTIKTLRKDAAAKNPRPASDKSKKGEVDKKWQELSRKMAEAWCKRLSAAAKAKEANRSGGDAATPVLPSGWRIGPNATVKAAYHLAWPDEAPPELAKLNLGHLELYYLRIEERGKLKRITERYQVQAGAKPPDVHVDGSTWIDRVGAAPGDKDRRRSIDVLIANPQGTPAAQPGMSFGKPERGKVERGKVEADADLTIEVLVIEVKDLAGD